MDDKHMTVPVRRPAAGGNAPMRAGSRAVSGAALVTLGLLLAGACNEITNPPNTPIGVLRLQVPDSSFADGASLVLVSATVDSSVAADQREVKFRTTAGTFNGQAETTVPSDSSRVAATFLKAPADLVTALVTATAVTGTRTAQIRFVRAYPETLTLQLEDFALRAGVTHHLEVTALLRRAIGVPTRGATVSFTAHDSTGSARGTFSAASTSDATGSVTARYTSPDTTYLGRVTIQATTRGPAGELLTDSASLQIVP